MDLISGNGAVTVHGKNVCLKVLKDFQPLICHGMLICTSCICVLLP